MCSENEARIMKAPGICSDRSSCWHTPAPSSRVKRPGFQVKSLHWPHIQLLVVLLVTGQASCNHSSTTPPSVSSTFAPVQTQVNYFFDVTVNVKVEKDESEITAWLKEVFQNNLQSCVSSTTAVPASTQTTAATTTIFTSTRATTTETSTVPQSTSTSTNATTAATTTAAMTTILTSTRATTTETSTVPQNTSTSTAATTPAATSTAATTATTATTAATSTAATTATTAATTATTTATTAATTTETSTAATTAATTTATTAATSTAATTATTATTAATSTAATSKTTTFTAATTSKTTTSTAETTSKTTTLTVPKATTEFKNSGTTLAATSTALKDTITTKAAITELKTPKPTSTASNPPKGTIPVPPFQIVGGDQQQNGIINMNTPGGNGANKRRVAREVNDRAAQTSDGQTGIFQALTASCSKKTAIKRTNCSVTLSVTQRLSPCCILRTLCEASKASSDFNAVGYRVDIINRLQNECESDPQEENRCIYTGGTSQSCAASSFMVPKRNSTQCGKKNTCSCSSYCSGTNAYYAFEISTQNPELSSANLLSVMAKLKETPECSTSTDPSCPSPSLTAKYEGSSLSCESTTTNLNCRVVLKFTSAVAICEVAEAVRHVFKGVKQIRFTRPMTSAAICGNSEFSLQHSELTWKQVSLKPGAFCPAINRTSGFECENGETLLILLNEQCALHSTTVRPNVTTIQPNTTMSVNVTTTPLTTTPNATVLPDTTTPNVTVLPDTTTTINVTVLPDTTTPNVTVLPDTTTPNVTVLPDTTTTINVTVLPDTTTPNVTLLPNTTTTNVTMLPDTTTPNVTVLPNTTTTTANAEGQANALLEMTQDVSRLNSSQINALVSDLERLLSGPNVSLALGNTSVRIVSNLLGASPEVLSDSSNRIIGLVDTVGEKLVLKDADETLISPDVALSVKPADGTNFQETVFSIFNPNDVQLSGGSRRSRSVRADSSIPQGSIKLPPSLTQNLSVEQQQLASRVQFNFYQKSTVFQDKSLGQRRLISGILGASVANLSISNLQDNVVISLRNTEPIPANFVATCVFWDFNSNDGSGGWNPNGCSVQNSTDNETVCGCNHLTSFAILLDLSREPLTSRLQATILTFITYIGCGISSIFLAITLLTYLAFGKLRKDIPSKILIQLCLALLLLNLVFLTDAWLALYPDAVGLCISTAWFLHYFLLVSFTWMGLEAVHMYLALVKVFNSYISRYMLKFSLVGWGVPMIVVIIVIAIDKNNYGLVSYGRFSDGTSDDFCWIKNDIAFYVAVVAYFCVIFLFNLVMFVVVLVQLCRLKRQNPHNLNNRTTLQDVRSVVGITVLLGLTWGFAFFAWGPVNLAFMYLFAIFNSLHGFFIFVFYCANKENVRRQWRTYLCCGRMRLAENSDWSRTATQKTMKKSSVTRLTPERSSKQSNSSSSSFLGTDSSEHLNGISSPFEDRAITADEEPSRDVIFNEINRQRRSQPSS